MGMDISNGGYQNSYDAVSIDEAKKELKRIVDRGSARAETLEDLRDTVGKSFKVSDLAKLMEKYDPDAYAQYSKIEKGTYASAAFMSKWTDKIKKGLKDGTISSDGVNNTSKSNESQLSAKAQEFLKNLRKRYGDYDFFVGNSSDNLRDLAKGGNKEFSIIFSSEELERMANDADYAKEKLQSMEQAVKMSEQISKQFGHGKGDSEITKIGIVFNDDGTTSFFAELEKSSAKQRERLEKSIEDKRAAKREEEKKTEKGVGSYSENRPDTKRTGVQANSLEELLEKIKDIDWDAVKAEKVPVSGGKYDFSI